MIVVRSWKPEEAEQKLRRRLEAVKRHREPWDSQGDTNAAVVYNALSVLTKQINVTFDNKIELESNEVDSSDSATGTNYVRRYTEFRLGVLAGSPPIAVARPTSSDYSDQLKANAADRLIQHGYRDKKIQSIFDQAIRKVLVRGWGWVKNVWDKTLGDVVDHNSDTDSVDLSGDMRIYSPATNNVWVDPLARSWEDVRYIFERHYIPLEEAVIKFEGKEKLLQTSLVKGNDIGFDNRMTGEDVVEIYEYWEKASPANGQAGRHAWITGEGKLLEPMTPNPHVHQGLPYYLITDSDVEDQVYAKSSVEYVARQQDLLNRFDSATVDAIEAHAVIRMALPESAEINDDEISTSSLDLVKYSGNIPPHFIQPASLPPDMPRMREQLRSEIQDMMGLNDAQLGNVKRETSGFAQQTAIESGNSSNRRLMNKYTAAVQAFWEDYLGLIRLHWEIPRQILVVGKNKAFEAYHYSSADIKGGFDVQASYGTSLPLDPNMAREQIMLLMQPLQQAGVPMTRILTLLKLDDIGAVYDELQMGEDRQREIFEEMIALHSKGFGNAYIPPEELENHESYLIYCRKYRDSMEFKVLAPEVKVLIDQHIRDRKAMAISVASKGAPQVPEIPEGLPIPPGAGGLPPLV